MLLVDSVAVSILPDGSSLEVDSQTVLSDLFDEHGYNIQDQAYWTLESLQPTARALNAWVVIPADHFPSRAHVICPTLFSVLTHKTFCTGDVFALYAENLLHLSARR